MLLPTTTMKKPNHLLLLLLLSFLLLLSPSAKIQPPPPPRTTTTIKAPVFPILPTPRSQIPTIIIFIQGPNPQSQEACTVHPPFRPFPPQIQPLRRRHRKKTAHQGRQLLFIITEGPQFHAPARPRTPSASPQRKPTFQTSRGSRPSKKGPILTKKGARLRTTGGVTTAEIGRRGQKPTFRIRDRSRRTAKKGAILRATGFDMMLIGLRNLMRLSASLGIMVFTQ
ncbi:proline-rich protein PRCC [Iris pallida]|uniref:Proline-rich protein PRCC n=1 Tax=Iris pallida TaxID=29817 RepID=A0AAX6EZ68_IRIPA|nr:proline-rich protein PRCC [Iris pallida]